MENEKNEARLPMLLAGVLTVVITVGLVALLLLGGGDEAPETVEPTTPTTVAQVGPPPDLDIKVPEVEDPAMVAWNEDMGPLIQRVISDVTSPPVSSIELLRIKCSRVASVIEQMREKPEPPKEDVAEAFDTWLLFLEDATVYCLDGSENLVEQDALTTAGGNLVSTMAYFDSFIEVLSNYVDFTKAPSNAPEPGKP